MSSIKKDETTLELLTLPTLFVWGRPIRDYNLHRDWPPPPLNTAFKFGIGMRLEHHASNRKMAAVSHMRK
jgi:hypothetical protein